MERPMKMQTDVPYFGQWEPPELPLSLPAIGA